VDPSMPGFFSPVPGNLVHSLLKSDIPEYPYQSFCRSSCDIFQHLLPAINLPCSTPASADDFPVLRQTLSVRVLSHEYYSLLHQYSHNWRCLPGAKANGYASNVSEIVCRDLCPVPHLQSA